MAAPRGNPLSNIRIPVASLPDPVVKNNTLTQNALTRRAASMSMVKNYEQAGKTGPTKPVASPAPPAIKAPRKR
jgi:hypothetical protein